MTAPNFLKLFRGAMRRMSSVLVTVLVLQSFSLIALPVPARADIADGANATDLIGQYDDTICSTQDPRYTKSDVGNGPNKFGFYAEDIVIDPTDHRLFVADSQNQRILVFNLSVTNELTDRVPDYVLGKPDFSTPPDFGATPSAANMTDPQGLAFDDTNNRLFVSDFNNTRVLVYNVTSITSGEDAVNVLGQTDFTSETGGTSASKFGEPIGLAYDPAGTRLFLADHSYHRVLVFHVAAITDGEDAVNVLGQTNFSNSGLSTNISGLYNVSGLAYDPTGNRLFVGEHSNNRVTVFHVASITDGEDAVNVLGQPDFDTNTLNLSISGMNFPDALAFDDANDRLFVADNDNGRVLVHDVSAISDGQDAANVLGQPDFDTSTDTVDQSTLGSAPAVAYDATNDLLYAGDGQFHRAMVFDVDAGVISDGDPAVNLLGQYDDTICSTNDPLYTKSGENNSPSKYGFFSPSYVAIDSVHHRLFVTDTLSSRVLVYNLTAGDDLVDRIADHVLGQPDFSSSASATTQAGMYEPQGLAYDSANDRLFVADSANDRVLSFDVASITDGENAANVLGQQDFVSGGNATTQSSMNQPHGLAYDSANGRLFVADTVNSRVLSFGVASITNGEGAANVLGQAIFTSTFMAVTQAGMNFPYGLAYDSANGRLFVADGNNNRVLSFGVASITDGENAANVLGQPDFVSGGDATTQAGMYEPRGLAYDATYERLFVADRLQSRVLSFGVASITNGENAANVLGQQDFVSGGSATTQAGMNVPVGLAYDSANDRLYVVDGGNNRVLAFDNVEGVLASPTGSTTTNKVLMSRLKQGVTSDVTVSFALPSAASGVLTVTFPAGFTVTSDPTSGGSSGCLGTFGHTAQTAFATKTGCSGAIYLGGFQVTNPGTPGSYVVTWVNDAPGEGGVAIVDEDQITVTATVDPSIAFDVGADSATCDGAWSSTDWTLPLGTLTALAVTRSDASGIDHICTKVSTNATSGVAVTVKSANGASGLVSASVPADTVPSANGAMAAGTANYGLCSMIGTISGSTASVPASADPVNGAFSVTNCGAANATIVAFSGTAQSAWTAPDPTNAGYAQFDVSAAVSGTTPAHSDYSDTLTWVATGTF